MAGHDANTLVQLAGRAERARRSSPHRAGPGGQRPELPRLARPRSRRVLAPVQPLPAGRLLLPDLPPPEGRVEALGADHPQLRRPWSGEPEGSAPLLRQGLPLLRRRRGRRRAGRHERRARGGGSRPRGPAGRGVSDSRRVAHLRPLRRRADAAAAGASPAGRRDRGEPEHHRATPRPSATVCSPTISCR